jgi:hypothetical protein
MSNGSTIRPNGTKPAHRHAGALALAIMASALASDVRAAPANQIAISYEVEVGSMSAMRISYNAELADDSYQSTASIKTKGLATMFSAYEMDMATSGSFDGDGLKPQHYRSKTDKKSADKILEVTWRSDDAPAVKTTPSDKEDEALIADALTTGLVDPLSMLLRMTALQAGKPCQSVERVVDGREVYDLRFALAGEVKIGGDSPGVYRGRAFKCSMTYTPIGGRPAVKFRKKGGAPSKFDIWFAPIKSATSDEALFVPVLATGKLQGLRFIAYARKASIGGAPIGTGKD